MNGFLFRILKNIVPIKAHFIIEYRIIAVIAFNYTVKVVIEMWKTIAKPKLYNNH